MAAALAILLTLAAPQAGAAGDAVAGPAPEEAIARVRGAHAALRGNRPELARREYVAAAAVATDVADWLLLRAAQLTADSAERASLYARIVHPPAAARTALVEALALERTGDLAGAARLYDAVGRPAEAARLRLRLGGASATDARRRLLELIDRRPTDSETVRALDVAVGLGDLSSAERLRVARAAYAARQLSRAVASYPAGLTAAAATPEDRLHFGNALRRMGRPREALTALRPLNGPPAILAAALLERARAEQRLLGDSVALRTLDLLATQPGATDSIAAEGLLLAGTLTWDAGQTGQARERFRTLAQRHPASPLAARGRYFSGLTAWELGEIAAAGAEFEAVRLQHPSSPEAAAAGYWAGRAWSRLGQEARARAAWESVHRTDTLSYYAVASADRLGVPPWSPPAAEDRFALFPEVDASIARQTVLEAMDLPAELAWERDWLVDGAAVSVERRLATAHAYRERGHMALAARMARAALAAGAPADARSYRLIYAFPLRDAVVAAATQAGVDPTLVAALTRQESLWDPRARSSAGARGLMQVMPATGAELARRLRLSPWRTEQLYDPIVNLRLGTTYLAATLERCQGDLVCALAGYNAGPGRAARWKTRPGADDRDYLIERIAFTETRDYVRIVQRNMAIYRALYADGS